MPTTPITPAASRLSGPPDRGGPPTDASPGDFAALLHQTTARTAPAEGHENRGDRRSARADEAPGRPGDLPQGAERAMAERAADDEAVLAAPAAGEPIAAAPSVAEPAEDTTAPHADDQAAAAGAEVVVPLVPVPVPTAPVATPAGTVTASDPDGEDAPTAPAPDATPVAMAAAASAVPAPMTPPAVVPAEDEVPQGAAPEPSNLTILPLQAPLAPEQAQDAPGIPGPDADASAPGGTQQPAADVPLPLDAAPSRDDRPHDHGRHRGHEQLAAQLADLATPGQPVPPSGPTLARDAAPGAQHRATPATPAVPRRDGEPATPAVPAQPAAKSIAPATADAQPAGNAAPTAAPPTAGSATDASDAAPTPAGAPAPVPPTAPAPSTPAPPANPAAWTAPALARGSMHQTVERVHELVRIAAMRDGGARATLQLRPVSLGTIDIQLRTTHDGLVATINARDESGLQALQQAGGELRRSLEDRGVNLARLDVQLSPSADGGAGQSGWGASSGAWADGGRSGAPASRATADDSAQDEPAEDELRVTSVTRTPAGSLVDVQA